MSDSSRGTGICTHADIEWTRSVATLVSLTGEISIFTDPLLDYDVEREYIVQRCLPTLPALAGANGELAISCPAFTWTSLQGLEPQYNDTSARNAAHTHPRTHDTHALGSLWSFHLHVGDRNWFVIGRFATVPLEASEVEWAILGLQPDAEYHVYDFWARGYVGVLRHRMRFPALALGHSQVLAFVPVCNHPQLIATTRHVSMDAVSLRNQQWDEATGLLHFDLNLVPGSVETFLVHTPAPWLFVDLEGNGCSYRAEVHALVVATVVAQGSDARLTMKFLR